MKRKAQAKQPKKTHSDTTQLTFLEHVYELRRRVFWIFLTLVVASAISFQYKDALISIVMAPLHGEKLVYLTPTGGFSFIFTLSIYVGLLFSIPVIVYHIYKFLQPIVSKGSRKLIATVLLLSALLATVGAAFGYFVTIPGAINFLSTFAGDVVTPNLTADSYLGFFVAYVVGLAVLFQLPLILFLIDHIHPIPPGTLSSTQRFVIIGATIVAAVITPTPDAVNMMIVALPIIAVYEVGALVVFIRRKAFRSTKKIKTAEVVPSATEDSLERIIERPVVKQAAVVPVEPQVAAPQMRTIDGVLATRKPPLTVVVPARRTIINERPTMRPLRSIDGMLA